MSSLGAQCAGNPSVSFEILLPGSVSDQAQWMELGVLPGACPSVEELSGGIPPTGALVRVAFEKGDTAPPAIGDLKKASYAFAAAARAPDCSVLATGCTQADVTEARDVSIAMNALLSPKGACAAGESCIAGRCAPSTNPDDPGIGAGCSMQLVGAGPFGVPLNLGGDVASAPAIAVTETGFLVAYREYDPGQGIARLTVGAIDPGGALTVPTPTMLQGQCLGQDESDAVGLAYLGGAGLAVSARPPCPGSTTGVDLLQVDAGGHVKQTAFAPVAAGAPGLSLHAAALTGASSGWLALLDQGAASVVALSGLGTSGNPMAFGAAPPLVLAEVAASDQMLALLSGDGTTLQLQLGAGAPASSDGGSPLRAKGTWGAVATGGTRAYVLSDGGSGAQPLAFGAYDLGGSSAATSATFAPPGQGMVAGGDVALHGDRVMFAAEQPGALSVIVYDHASTSPTLLRSVLLSGDARIPAQDTVRDGRVAIAASDSRVLVAWMTAAQLGPDDPVGGYALYACAP